MITRLCRSAKCAGTSRHSATPNSRRHTPIDQDRRHPERCLHAAVHERRRNEQTDHDARVDREAEHPAANASAVASGQRVEGDLRQPHQAVGDREAEPAVAECLRDAEGDDEQASRRGQHHEPNRAFLWLDQARQPGETDPRPPQHRQHEHPSADPRPTRLGRHQRGALREPEHEDQVEEQLERLDGLPLAELQAEPWRMFPGSPAQGHRLSVNHRRRFS